MFSACYRYCEVLHGRQAQKRKKELTEPVSNAKIKKVGGER